MFFYISRNFKLLSFGDEAEEEEEEVLAATKNFSTKGNSAHDIAQDPTLSASTGKAVETDSETIERYSIYIVTLEIFPLQMILHCSCTIYGTLARQF